MNQAPTAFLFVVQASCLQIVGSLEGCTTTKQE